MTSLDIRDEDGRETLYWGDDVVGTVERKAGVARVALLDVPPAGVCREVLTWLRARDVTELGARSTALRYEARRVGFAGPLRGALTWTGEPAGDFIDTVRALLPGLSVELAPHGRLRGIIAGLMSGMADMTQLKVRASDARPPVVVSLPDRPDLNAEAVAGAIDVTYAVHARFGHASHHVRTLSFDQSMHDMVTGKVAGAAPRNLGVIHLNANMAFVSGTETMARQRVERRAANPALVQRAVAEVPAPWSSLDATTAHELWHKIELAWETERFADSVEFRRALGALFAKETLEKVFADDDALRVLAREVSGYATTNRLEATAEMFKRWWCGPAPKNSIPEQFGVIVNRFFPDSGAS